jgi:2-hydroxycyclohexanecarboxyl-CoA dehydrogenase
MDFTGKTIVVTGGSSGIGRATVLNFATAGGNVFFGDINEKGAEETIQQASGLPGRVAFHKLDLESKESITQFAQALHGNGGKADVLANVAGWDVGEPFIKNTPEFMEKVITINLMGCIRVTRAFLDPMIEHKAGKVVTVSSDAGRVGSLGESVYAGAKGGAIAFTKSLAREMARFNINVNCVCPGPTDTPLLAAVPEKHREAFVRVTPMQRLAKPSEIADAVLFFASARSDFITGQILSVSGGLTMAG